MRGEFALNVTIAVKLGAIVKSDGVVFDAAPLNRTSDGAGGERFVASRDFLDDRQPADPLD